MGKKLNRITWSILITTQIKDERFTQRKKWVDWSNERKR